MTIYAHVSLDDKRTALSKLGEALADAVAVTVAVNQPRHSAAASRRRLMCADGRASKSIVAAGCTVKVPLMKVGQ
jgi:hypothetical protein